MRAQATEVTRTSSNPVLGAARILRSRQWLKNLIVVAAPIAAGVLLEPTVLGALSAAFLCFSMVASALYIVNDVVDVEADRLHPRKRHRPLPAGQISVRGAMGLAAVLVIGALA